MPVLYTYYDCHSIRPTVSLLFALYILFRKHAPKLLSPGTLFKVQNASNVAWLPGSAGP